MHYMPDTSEADAATETFWPENYKRVIREDFYRSARFQLGRGRLKHPYQQAYSQEYASLNEFTDRLAGMVAIGAENGTDDAFDNVYSSFLTESPLPDARKYSRFLLPRAFSESVLRKIRDTVIADYSQEKVFQHAYKVGYQGSYANLPAFISRVAELVIAGAMLGADDMLARIYRSFFLRLPLPPARRNPKRLRSW